jgi:hypothetical protein
MARMLRERSAEGQLNCSYYSAGSLVIAIYRFQFHVEALKVIDCDKAHVEGNGSDRPL